LPIDFLPPGGIQRRPKCAAAFLIKSYQAVGVTIWLSGGQDRSCSGSQELFSSVMAARFPHCNPEHDFFTSLLGHGIDLSQSQLAHKRLLACPLFTYG